MSEPWTSLDAQIFWRDGWLRVSISSSFHSTSQGLFLVPPSFIPYYRLNLIPNTSANLMIRFPSPPSPRLHLPYSGLCYVVYRPFQLLLNIFSVWLLFRLYNSLLDWAECPFFIFIAPCELSWTICDDI
jgi:hypothetical protein